MIAGSYVYYRPSLPPITSFRAQNRFERPVFPWRFGRAVFHLNHNSPSSNDTPRTLMWTNFWGDCTFGYKTVDPMFPLSLAGSHSPPHITTTITFALIAKLILTFLHSNRTWFKSKLLLYSFLLLPSSLQLLLHLLTRKFWFMITCLSYSISYCQKRTGPAGAKRPQKHRHRRESHLWQSCRQSH